MMTDKAFSAMAAKLKFLVRSFKGRLPNEAMRSLEEYISVGEHEMGLEQFCGALVANNVATNQSDKELIISLSEQMEEPQEAIEWVKSNIKASD